MRVVFGLVLPLTMLATGARSQAAEESGDSNNIQSASGKESTPDRFSDQWRFQLGGGVINVPRYPGSRDDANRVVPILGISYGRYFVGGVPGGGGAPAGIGVYLVKTAHWSFGLDVGDDVRKPRRASDAPILHGWGDIPGTVHGGLFSNYTIEWLTVHGSVSAGGHNEGVRVSLGVDLTYQATPRLRLSVGPEVTWVNNQYAMTFFGIDTPQSEIGGIAQYRARSGVNSLGGSARANYMLTARWSLAALVSYARLQGDAANSPVTTDKNQRVYGAFVMYRF